MGANDKISSGKKQYAHQAYINFLLNCGYLLRHFHPYAHKGCVHAPPLRNNG